MMDDDAHEVEVDRVYSVRDYGADADVPALLIGVDRDASGMPAGSTRFIASTTSEDRHGTVVRQDWRLRSFRSNPVILWMHSRSLPPIGAGAAKIDGRDEAARLLIDARWDIDDPAAALVAGKFERGFLNAGSVSFRVGKATDRAKLPKEHPAYREVKEGDSSWWPSMYYERCELLEFSAVTIPSNPDALALRALGIEAGSLDAAARRVLPEIVTRTTAAMILDAIRSDDGPLRAAIAEALLGDPTPKVRASVRSILLGAPERNPGFPPDFFKPKGGDR